MHKPVASKEAKLSICQSATQVPLKTTKLITCGDAQAKELVHHVGQKSREFPTRLDRLPLSQRIVHVIKLK